MTTHEQAKTTPSAKTTCQHVAIIPSTCDDDDASDLQSTSLSTNYKTPPTFFIITAVNPSSKTSPEVVNEIVMKNIYYIMFANKRRGAYYGSLVWKTNFKSSLSCFGYELAIKFRHLIIIKSQLKPVGAAASNHINCEAVRTGQKVFIMIIIGGQLGVPDNCMSNIHSFSRSGQRERLYTSWAAIRDYLLTLL